MKISTKQLVFMALLTSISIILTRVASLRISFAGVEGIRIGLGDLPIIMSGMMLGPLSGGLVGAVSDIIGYFINPMGAYMPHFTFVKALTGIIPGIMIAINGKGYKNPLYLGWIVFITQLVTSTILTPYFLQVIFGIPMKVTILPRAMALIMYTFAFPFIMHTLLNRMSLMNFCRNTLSAK
ncbi:MAG: Substrate-specific component FolT of folate ECF transporter [Firmicutes bacterium]|nr:Substrate-specific component FolT of folate ECF transporter [Bacillota bacterium]MDI6704865.1 folate family ECF transporter S component [Bacillota bacterium]